MYLVAAIVGIATVGILASAAVYAAVYFTIGRLFAPSGRAIMSGLISAFAVIAYFVPQVPGLTWVPIMPPADLVLTGIYLIGIALWTWRTKAGGRR